MKTLTDFALRHKYEQVRRLRSRLEDMNNLLDWDAFVRLFPSRDGNRGRPAYETVLKLKLLFLQSWYGISDEELEFQVNDRLSFQQFLGYPERIPDYSTVWRFREELQEGDLTERIWDELRHQINEKHICVEKGKIQDARFIDAPPGKKSTDKENRGREAKTSRNQDATWTKKNGTSHFGYKLHTKTQRKSKLIEEIAVTTAKVHDNNIDLGKPGEVLYRDKAWTGTPTKATGNGSMKRGKLSVKEQFRNKRIAKKRCQGEHQYGTMQRSMRAGITRLTTIGRVYVQQLFVSAAYNIYRLRFLVKQ